MMIKYSKVAFATAFLLITTHAAPGNTKPAAAAAATAAPASGYLAPIAVKNFYTQNGEQKIWTDNTRFADLLLALKGLHAHGLNPNHYHFDALSALGDATAQREKLATDAWFSAASHMIYGKLDPLTIEPDWTAARRNVDLAAKLQAALETGTVAGSLEDLAPRQTGYHALKTELAHLRALADKPITQIPAGGLLRLGDAGARVKLLNTRLVDLGYLEAQRADAASFDEATKSAVQQFQTMMGLEADGIVGPASLAALNRSIDDKIKQVRVNMERWRWLPDELGRRHIRVNIAGFNLTTWEDGVPVKTHRTIVGQAYRKTPVFSGAIRYVIFNPWWETPPSLARKDKLPAFQKDPEAVKRLGFEVLNNQGQKIDPDTINWQNLTASNFPYRLRQQPGPLNALGQVKIMFPNQHNVYIHDTPNRELFSRSQRAMSSGCVRTQDPLALTAWLLEETPAWPLKAQEDAVASQRETRANLSAPVPVHILYATVVPETDGAIRYLDDVYDRDSAVLTGLQETFSPPSAGKPK